MSRTASREETAIWSVGINESIDEVERATGGYATREHWTRAEFGGTALIVASDILDHRPQASADADLSGPGRREFHGRISFDERHYRQTDRRRHETIPACGPYPGGIDAQMFLRAIFDHAWEQGFRPDGFQDRPREIARWKSISKTCARSSSRIRRLMPLDEDGFALSRESEPQQSPIHRRHHGRCRKTFDGCASTDEAIVKVINELSAPAFDPGRRYDTMYRRLADGLIVLLAIKRRIESVKHCESIDIETTPAGAIFRGFRWPKKSTSTAISWIICRTACRIRPHGHPAFPGAQRLCRLSEIRGTGRVDGITGLMENQLMAEAPVSAPEPALAKADQKYFAKTYIATVHAFQWLPHAVPPVALPEWFMRAELRAQRQGRANDPPVRRAHESRAGRLDLSSETRKSSS